MASAFPLKQFILCFVANKNTILLLAFLDFVGANHCFIGVLNFRNQGCSNGLHAQKQCKINPSAMGQKRRQVCDFLFTYWGDSDCFSGKAGAIDLKER